MWWVMMTAMMVPSAAPFILLVAAVHRRRHRRPPVRDREAAERTLLTPSPMKPRQPRLRACHRRGDGPRVRRRRPRARLHQQGLRVLDLIGWERADAVLTSVVGQMVAARGGGKRPRGATRRPCHLMR